MNKTPSEMTQQELYLEIARLAKENDKLKRTKKFGLVWENKNDAKVEEVRRSAPILVEDSTKRVINDPNDVNHVLINGDNFQAMTALRATHAGKVDVIYIDPPYNTGNKDFIYNDKFVDAEDGYRHSLWLSFMQKRLILAKELLSETGVIFVSIDDNEQARLKLIMDDIFGAQNFVAQAVWQGGRKNDSKLISVGHDYFLIYSKNKELIKGKWRSVKPESEEMIHKASEIYEEEIRKFAKNNTAVSKLINSYDKHEPPIISISYEGYDEKPSLQIWLSEFVKKPNSWWYENLSKVSSESTKRFKKWINGLPEDSNVKNSKHYNQIDERGRLFFADNISWPGGGGPRYTVNHIVTGNPVPIPSQGWRYQEEKMMQEINNGNIYFKESDKLGINKKSYLANSSYSVLDSVFYKDRRSGNKILSSILGNNIFDFPKDVNIIGQWINYVSQNKKNAIILDFFAGSGTTAHAVAELNKEDGGKRQCILITDGGKTETSGESSKNANENAVNIAEEITYERVKRVLTGKGWADGKEHEPLGGNLFYLNTVMKYVGTIDAKSKEPYFCPSNSTAFSLDTGVWHPILEEVGEFTEWPFQKRDYKLFALPKGEDGKQNYALTINASDWEFTAFKEWFDKNMPEDSTVFLYADSFSHAGCEWMEELEMVKDPRLAEVNITKRLINNHNWVAHSFLKTDI